MSNESYTVNGKLYKKNPQQVISEKFSKIDFIMITDGEYPQYLQIQAGNDKMSLLDGVNGGDNVIVKLNVKGRKWVNPEGEEKFFNSLELWQLIKVQEAAQQAEKAEIIQNDLSF